MKINFLYFIFYIILSFCKKEHRLNIINKLKAAPEDIPVSRSRLFGGMLEVGSKPFTSPYDPLSTGPYAHGGYYLPGSAFP
ncbi:hypothetical protein CWI39_2194p0010 [Hamiltosporidium magnivora]|uniref:Uncharacterized protein n=1 Tax=Hamiltosporidium magnivora TaxID=148818 RepID=A0A4Q9KXR0_9MICR|nr:hypothetical protein CWI39_2194p0010 [Hamiltosporidium magnivora]